MSPSVAAALRAIQAGVTLLEAAVADTEPAPITVVLVRVDSGKVHRAVRIEGIPGLMTYESDNFDMTEYRVIADLSSVSDDLDLCRRCFGSVDASNDETDDPIGSWDE